VQKIQIKYANGNSLHQEVQCRSVNRINNIAGTVLIATKANANKKLALKLRELSIDPNILIMQNGIGVENPFLDNGFKRISRCVVYITAEKHSNELISARMVKPSPIGSFGSSNFDIDSLISEISTDEFSFYSERNITREVWKKAIINVAFNSICPILDIDNGIFFRDSSIMEIAKMLINECLPVAHALNIDIKDNDIYSQILGISERSNGQLISTLQDIRNNRDTEIEYLNLEICRLASKLQLKNNKLPLTEMLGNLVKTKAEISKSKMN